jgi:hypothetical protein
MVERSDEAPNEHNAVDGRFARAYGDFIPSVPQGTSPVRHNGLRSAHSADRPRARFGAHPLRHRSLSKNRRARFDLQTVGCEPDRLVRRCVLRTTPGNEASFLKRNARWTARARRDRRRTEHSSRGTMPAHSPHPRSTGRRVDRHIDASERAHHHEHRSRDWVTAMEAPERAEADPEPISIARCRELLGDEADALNDDEVRDVARHAEAMARVLIALALQDRRIH